MQIDAIPFETVDWASIVPTEHPGTTGVARWHTRQFGSLRVRMVEYSPGYTTAEWCEKGHVVLCVHGELHTELADGRIVVLTPGKSYVVADGAMAHQSSAPLGATLFIVD